MTHFLKLACFLSIFVSIGACTSSVAPNGDAQGFGGKTSNELLSALSLNMSQVSAFAQSNTSSSSTSQNTSTAGTYNLNYLLTEGMTGAVSFTGSTQDQFLQSVYPTPKYLLAVPDISFNVTQNGVSCSVIAVRYSDGALFCIPNVAISPNPGLADGIIDPVQWDATQDIIFFQGYFLDSTSGYTTLMKMDFGSASTPTVSQLYSNAGHVEQFAINSLGDSFFRAAPTSNRILQLVTQDNQVQSFGTWPYADCLTTGVGSTANDFFFTSAPGATGNGVYRVSENGSTIYTQSTYFADPNNTLGLRYCASIFKNSASVYVSMIGTTEPVPQYPQIIELVNQALVPKKIPVPGTNVIHQIQGNDSQLVLRADDGNGGTLLVEYIIGTATLQTLVPAGVYLINDVSMLQSGKITFAGTRLSDSASVIAEIPSGSTSVNILTAQIPSVSKVFRLQ